MPDPTLRELHPISCVVMERAKQDAKWGEQNHPDLEWFAILMEEVGEAAQCISEVHINPTDKSDEYYDLLEYELIQIAAVAVAWVECIRRREA